MLLWEFSSTNVSTSPQRYLSFKYNCIHMVKRYKPFNVTVLFTLRCFSSYADAPTEYKIYTSSRCINVKFSLLHCFNNIDSKQDK